MIEEVRKSADHDSGMLKNRLHNMTVINNNRKYRPSEVSMNGEMQIHEGEYYNNMPINKEAVLNNWI